MKPELIPCSRCGQKPVIGMVCGRVSNYYLYGCRECGVSSPARMDITDAAEQWNAGIRNDAEGNRISDGVSIESD